MAVLADRMEFTPEQLVSASIMRLSTSDRNPFFAALALMAPVVITPEVDTAATDGAKLYFNPKFLAALSPRQRDGLVVHEVLHAALLHVTRRGEREPLLWNIACDIVVNGMVLADSRLELPAGTVRDLKLEHLPAEEIYQLLLRDPDTVRQHLGIADIRPDLSGLETATDRGDMDPELRRRLEEQWNLAVTRAVTACRQRGDLPGNIERHFGSLTAPKVDWRTRLWQYMARTPDDFSGFDRRHLWNGLYLEELQDETVFVDVCVDTSRSIGSGLLEAFMSEVRGIVDAYHRVIVRLFYCDATCHGPFTLTRERFDPPHAIGGGGTDFRPFFETVRKNPPATTSANHLLVYLTDGEGEFPEKAPEWACLWVVVPGGLQEDRFPFGEVTRMI